MLESIDQPTPLQDKTSRAQKKLFLMGERRRISILVITYGKNTTVISGKYQFGGFDGNHQNPLQASQLQILFTLCILVN